MDQRSAQQSVRHLLQERGFRPVHETTAVTLLTHPAYPDVTVRMGTTRVVAERNRLECYRSRLSDFDPDALITCIVYQPDLHDASEADRV